MRNGKITDLQVDNNLMYVIQKVTGHPTEEVLPNLWEALTIVVNDVLKHSRASRISREFQVFYSKDERLPISIKLYGRTGYGEPEGKYDFHASIGFPKKMMKANVELINKAYDERLEKAIGLTDTLAKLAEFGKPDLKLSKRLKKIL